MRSPRNKSRFCGEKKFAAFDFNEDEESVEKKSRNMLSKFFHGNEKKLTYKQTIIDKYTFLEAFAGKGDKIEQNNTANVPVYVDDSDDETDKKIVSVSSRAKSCVPQTNKFEGSSNYSPPKPIIDIEPVLLDSDDDHISESKCEEADSIEIDCVISETEKTVVIKPNYIIYLGMVSTECELTFSSQGIKLLGSTKFGPRKSCSFEWAISEIVNIESVWSESVKMAEICICHRTKDTKLDDKANVSPGFAKFNFAVTDLEWYKTEEAIKSLNLRYNDTWNTVVDIDTLETEDVSLTENRILYLEYNIQPKVVNYPEGDPDAVSISTREVELLKPETFINDTIVDFYIKHLVTKIDPSEMKRFHFFNSFFFRKLADLDKHSSREDEGKVAFQRVRKWTKNVNLFDKDFIFIPVNFSLHWSLIVICYPGKLVKPRDEQKPCIIHMDSIKGSHSGLRNLFRSYLREEWKNRHEEDSEDLSARFLKLQFMPLELPQQQNSYDCGLFLLHYVELFLEMALADTNPLKEMINSSFLQKKWFEPAEASEKRAHVRRLMCETIGSKYPEEISGAGEGYSCNFTELNNPDVEVEITSPRPKKFDDDTSILDKPQVANILSPILEGKEKDEEMCGSSMKKGMDIGIGIGNSVVNLEEYDDDPMDESSLIACISNPKSTVNLEYEDETMEESSERDSSTMVEEEAEEEKDEECKLVIEIHASPHRALALEQLQELEGDDSDDDEEEFAGCTIEDSDVEEVFMI